MRSSRRGYSLASLLTLIAVAAVLLTLCRSAWVHNAKWIGLLGDDDDWIFAALAAAAVAGCIIGAVVGYHSTQWLGTLKGGAGGFVIGGLGGWLLLAPASIWAYLGGAAVLILCALATRRFSTSPADSGPEGEGEIRSTKHEIRNKSEAQDQNV